jgi:hypothetical protein
MGLGGQLRDERESRVRRYLKAASAAASAAAKAAVAGSGGVRMRNILTQRCRLHVDGYVLTRFPSHIHLTGAKAGAWCLLIHADALLSPPLFSST